jgi:hypothetical protein
MEVRSPRFLDVSCEGPYDQNGQIHGHPTGRVHHRARLRRYLRVRPASRIQTLVYVDLRTTSFLSVSRLSAACSCRYFVYLQEFLALLCRN